jgi:flavin reductase (DIM6/NTAB) family NADH-FMN oxidoreductase RutF
VGGDEESRFGPDRVSDRIVDQLDAPVFLVTTADGSERSGCLIGFATQCSIDPWRFLVCVSHLNHTAGVVRGASTVVVHVPREGDHGLAALFAEETGDEIDKFARCDWSPGPDGIPVLAGLDWFAGRIVSRTDVGDHQALVLEPTGEGEVRGRGRVLTYEDVRDFDPGHPARS